MQIGTASSILGISNSPRVGTIERAIKEETKERVSSYGSDIMASYDRRSRTANTYKYQAPWFKKLFLKGKH